MTNIDIIDEIKTIPAKRIVQSRKRSPSWRPGDYIVAEWSDWDEYWTELFQCASLSEAREKAIEHQDDMGVQCAIARVPDDWDTQSRTPISDTYWREFDRETYRLTNGKLKLVGW